MRETQLWERISKAVGPTYAQTWAQSVVLAELGGRTVTEALAAGIRCKAIWHAAWAQLELPLSER